MPDPKGSAGATDRVPDGGVVLAVPVRPVCQAGPVPKPPPADEPAPASAPFMPPSVRVAVVVMAVLAVLLLSNAILLWVGFDVAVDRIVDENDDVTRAGAEQFVILSLVPYLLLGVALALAAGFVPRRHGWARWVGVAATGLLALLTLVSVLATGGVSIASLLLLVLSVAGVTSLMARTTRSWFPGAVPAG